MQFLWFYGVFFFFHFLISIRLLRSIQLSIELLHWTSLTWCEELLALLSGLKLFIGRKLRRKLLRKENLGFLLRNCRHYFKPKTKKIVESRTFLIASQYFTIFSFRIEMISTSWPKVKNKLSNNEWKALSLSLQFVVQMWFNVSYKILPSMRYGIVENQCQTILQL